MDFWLAQHVLVAPRGLGSYFDRVYTVSVAFAGQYLADHDARSISSRADSQRNSAETCLELDS